MKVKHILTSKFYIFICLAVLASLAFFILKDYYQSHAIRSEFNDLQSKIKALEIEKQKITETQKYLETQTYFERQAREKLSLKKPGEEVMFIKELKQTGKIENSAQDLLQSSQLESSGFGNLVKWLRFWTE